MRVMVEKVIKEFSYRNTKMGALTKYVVLLNGKVIYPSSTKRSKTGNHGSDYYALTADEWAKAWIIILEKSNSGKRSIGFSDNVPEEAKKQITDVWLYTNSCVNDIIQLAKVLQLSMMLRKN